jgi:DNA-directed RNA polymerase specialized sigma24 family protein
MTSRTDQSGGSRLDVIGTQWSLVRQAHVGGQGQSVGAARHSLVLRYAKAVRRYVGGMVRKVEDADELAQEVIVRLLKGDFAGADPNRGWFRDLLKTAVRNMVHNHWAKENRRRPADVELDAVAEGRPGADWDAAWRQNVLDQTWAAYKEQERGSPAYVLMKLRAEFPDACRPMLRRARLRFAVLLLRDVQDGLADPSAERVVEELDGLGLLEYVRDFLPDDWKTSGRLVAQ